MDLRDCPEADSVHLLSNGLDEARVSFARVRRGEEKTGVSSNVDEEPILL